MQGEGRLCPPLQEKDTEMKDSLKVELAFFLVAVIVLIIATQLQGQ